MVNNRRQMNRRNNFPTYKRSKYDFCRENIVDYKDASLLRKFITDRGRIDSGLKSGNSAKCHREVTKAIKRARYLALLPYAPQHERVTGPMKIFEFDDKSTDSDAIESSPKAEESTEKEESPKAEESTEKEESPKAEESTEKEESIKTDNNITS